MDVAVHEIFKVYDHLKPNYLYKKRPGQMTRSLKLKKHLIYYLIVNS